MRGYTVGVLEVESPALLKLVEVISRARLGGILARFGVVRESAANRSDCGNTANQTRVEIFGFASIRRGRIDKVTVEIVQRWIAVRQPQGDVGNTVGRIPIVILLAIKVESEGDGVDPVDPRGVVGTLMIG